MEATTHCHPKNRTVRIPDKVMERAQRYVNDGGAVSVSELIRLALDQKLVEVGY